MSRYGDLPPEDDVFFSDAQKNLILHVSLSINEFTVLMGSDVNEQFCSPANAILNKGNNHYISINLENDDIEARRLFNLLSIGGVIEMPLQKPFGAHCMALLATNLELNGWLTASFWMNEIMSASPDLKRKL